MPLLSHREKKLKTAYQGNTFATIKQRKHMLVDTPYDLHRKHLLFDSF
jgi:hypothetical protein